MTADRRALASVIIPAFNAESSIAETIASVTAQTWEDIEILVVDDGSTDQTRHIASRSADRRVKVYSQAKAGAAAARNRGLRESRGDFIQFLDADDLLSATKIELQINALLSSEPNSVASCPWAHFVDTPADAVFVAQPVWLERNPIEWLIQSLSGGGMMQTATWMTPKSLIDRAGPWNENLSLHDDGAFFARVLGVASSNIFVEDARVFYRNTSTSLSRVRGRRAIESAFAVCRIRQEVVSSHRNDISSRKAIATQYAQFVYEFGREAPDLAEQALLAIRETGAEPSDCIGGPAFRKACRVLGFSKAIRLRRSAAFIPG